MLKIPYGISDYKTLKEENYYYVDKTSYLEKLENIGKVLVYLRPGRFGKTLFTSMMFYYYDIKSKDKFDTLFKDTDIYIEPTSLRNSYYVLRLDFSGMSNISNVNIEQIEEKFKDKVVDGIKKFLHYHDIKINIDYNKDASTILSNFLSELNFNKKIYIIIDEYDNFTNAILEDNANLFEQILGKNGFVKDFYARIKENCDTTIDRFFITGVCSISIDAMTSGFNVATNITNDIEFNAMSALTHDEVKVLISDIDKSKQEEIFDTMIKNYDGYKFNSKVEEKVFNPTLVMYYLSIIIDWIKNQKSYLIKI